MKFFKSKKQKGLTLIEFILVLSVFSLLMLGVYNLAANVTSSTTAVSEADKINTTIEKIERVVGVSGDFSNINMAVFNEITENYVSNFNLIGVRGEFANFFIDYRNVPGKACTKFVESIILKNENVSALVNGTSINYENDLGLISEACQEDNEISIVLNNNTLTTLANMSTVVPLPIAVPNSAPVWGVSTKVYSGSGDEDSSRTYAASYAGGSGSGFTGGAGSAGALAQKTPVFTPSTQTKPVVQHPTPWLYR